MISPRTFSLLPVFGGIFVLVSCATEDPFHAGGSDPMAPAYAGSSRSKAGEKGKTVVDDGRIRIYRASQTVEVSEVETASARVADWVQARKGYLEASREAEDDSANASFTIRVTAEDLDSLLDQFASLGKQASRRVTAEDTTDAYHDLQARIHNTEALRDRLRRLLDEAKGVKEILEIEKELARVQSDLDAMKGRFQRMDAQVRLATIELQLRTKKIPGPVGAANRGFWWGIKKLFVLN